MKENIVKYPEVKEIVAAQREYPPNYIFPEERCRYQNSFIRKYFLKILSGWSIADFFEKVAADKIAVYALTDFADYVICDLKRCGNARIVIADKRAGDYKNGRNGEKVYTQMELYGAYKNGDINKVVVCSFFRANEIMQELLNIGFALNDIVTITTILVNDN